MAEARDGASRPSRAASTGSSGSTTSTRSTRNTGNTENTGNTVSHHHGEDDGGAGSFDGPEQDEAEQLDEGEEVHLAQGHVAQVDEVRLVLGRHPEQLQAVEELRGKGRRRHLGAAKAPGAAEVWSFQGQGEIQDPILFLRGAAAVFPSLRPETTWLFPPNSSHSRFFSGQHLLAQGIPQRGFPPVEFLPFPLNSPSFPSPNTNLP